MTEETTGSTLQRRQLGRRLRDLRLCARLTVRAAAEALEWSETKMWRIETGQTAMRGLDVEAMCRIYGATAEVMRGLMKLAKAAKATGWWQTYDDVLPEYFDAYLGMEEAASQLLGYEPQFVPGLFQISDYSAALFRTSNPGMPEGEIERRVRFRMTRQGLLTRVAGRPELHAVIDEAALRRPIGGRAVMAAQLRRLIEVSDLPNVTLQVIPFRVGGHIGLDTGAFVLVRFPLDIAAKETEPPLVFQEGFTGCLYLEKPSEVQRFGDAFATLVDSALDARASQSFILQAAREFEQ
ncbi:helix-turn-helix transcriptional regulator [Flindersiella endophytica]